MGKLLEGRTPKQAVELKVLDPACGSGSFLIGAYQCLLDWHRDWYVTDGVEKHRKVLYQGMGGEWRLTTKERTRILLNNIYGVDIDPQAVEVTKLSLLLKVLEGGSPDVLQREFWAAHERVLPDLAANIKCGNSLIALDFYGSELALGDDQQRYDINPFEWTDAFPEVLGDGVGGFDAVIGNPPYVLLQTLNKPPVFKSGGRQSVHESTRIGVRQIGETPVATVIPGGIYALNTIYNVFFTRDAGYSLEFVLGILQSRAVRFYWKQSFFDQKRTFPKIKKDALLSVPIPRDAKRGHGGAPRADRITVLVLQVLQLAPRAERATTEGEREGLLRQITAIDRQIDQLVYELYGLTDEEIRIVEEATP